MGSDKKEKKDKKKKKTRTKEEKEQRKLMKKRKREQEEGEVEENQGEDVSPKRPRTRSSEKRLKAIAKGDDIETSAQAAEREAQKARLLNSQPIENFSEKISDETIKVLKSRGMTSLFEIQCRTFGPIIEGNDVVGRARTGMGKTLAFSLPTIELIKKRRKGSYPKHGRAPVVCIMAPTRELAKQVAGEFEATAPDLQVLTVYGGTPYNPQVQGLRRGVDVVVGTCGRLCDLIDRGNLILSNIDFLILDEADQMLDMGFKDEMDKVFDGIKDQRDPSKEYRLQTLLFSATMPGWVKDVAQKKMTNPITIDLVRSDEKQVSKDVQHLCCMCPWQTQNKTISDLIRMYGNQMNDGRTIVFCSTKKDCNELSTSSDFIHANGVIHGDISQQNRESTLEAFRHGKLKVMIATDVAARGLDISGVDLVIQKGPPCGNYSGKVDVESYTHRSGRTGRAGRKGICITLFKWQQESIIKDLEWAIKSPLKRVGAPSQQISQSLLRASLQRPYAGIRSSKSH